MAESLTRRVFALIGAAVVALSATAAAQPVAAPFAKCSELFARQPDNYDSAYCFYEVAQQKNLWDEGERVFDSLIAAHPGNHWLPLAYGHVFRSRNPDRAEALYRQAADGFKNARHVEGEILARSNLRNFLFPKGRVKEAALEMERVAALGAASTDPLLKARAWTLEATHVQDAGGDLGRAYRLLKQTERSIFPNGPYRLRRSTLNSLGLVAFRLGRLDEALTIFRNLDDLAGAEGETLVQANAQYNILNTSALIESLMPSPGAKTRLMQMAERSLATAMRAQNRDMTLKTHRALAELLAKEPGGKEKALEHIERCLELAAKLRQPHDEAVCSWVKTSLLAKSSPKEAQAAELRAVEATTRANSPRTQAYSAQRRMHHSWETKPRSEALEDALADIDAIEALRSLQDDSDASAELFSTWTSDYHWLSGRLLESASPDDRALAFTITERMRARSLLDTLERSRARPDPKHPTVVARRELLQSIVDVQRTLMDPTIAPDERRKTIDRLQDLELKEREARRRIHAAFPAAQAAPRAFATLADARSGLADNEALLSYQVGLWETYDGEFGGGAWLIATAKGQEKVYRLPDRAQLAAIVPVFTGLLQRADGLDALSAARLYDELLAPAIRDLPSGIQKLVVVPDGPLHNLPFDALRMGRDGPPVATRFEIAVVPSATLWRHWRTSPKRTATGKALAFADPNIGPSRAPNAVERNAALERGLSSGRLPYARRESGALVRYLGDVDALLGARASERALKDRDLDQYDLVHFAVHAIADEARPERSAVLLAPGGRTEDGLLQSREIQTLNLRGKTVVLSACQTASGTVLSGEGVLSLARSFFEAGAQAVIGSRWPIRDEDAAWLFEAFYARLGQGASLSEALKDAKTLAIQGGRPSAAWASLVLLGDGNVRPIPGGRPLPATTGSKPGTRAGAFGLGVLVAVPALFLLWRLTRK
jgi:CHAT domain-containing protein